LYTIALTVKCYSLWKTVWRFLIKLKLELPYDPAIPLDKRKTKNMAWVIESKWTEKAMSLKHAFFLRQGLAMYKG
jgi:hypothetical protein